MKLKKLRKIMGCLVLTGAMIMSMPQMVMAAGTETAAQTTPDTEGNTDSETPEDTETPTEPETSTEPDTEPQTEPNTEPQTDTGGETEPGTDTEPETDPTVDIDKGDIDKDDIKDVDKGDEIKKPDDGKEKDDHSDANANLTSNIIAGNGVYLGELSGSYYLTFAEGFESVMEAIEADYRQWLDSPDEFIAYNWQDVLAVYVLRVREATGNNAVTLNEESKEELEKVFFQMNIRSDSSMANKLSKEVDLGKEVCALTVEDYAELRNLNGEQKEILDKYVSDNCTQLCAIVTAAKGFVRAEVGEGVSEQRVSIVSAALSLVGKVGYFWGGKSYAIGWDSVWGNPMTVTAAGSRSSGTSRGYGLDCSGFVCWSYYNGLGGTDGGIGNHTTPQWNGSAMVDSAAAQPGDMVFYNSPAAGDQNHIGVVIGKNTDGSLLVAHCSSSQNGVVVGEAWSSGFKYVRSPLSLS